LGPQRPAARHGGRTSNRPPGPEANRDVRRASFRFRQLANASRTGRRAPQASTDNTPGARPRRLSVACFALRTSRSHTVLGHSCRPYRRPARKDEYVARRRTGSPPAGTQLGAARKRRPGRDRRWAREAPPFNASGGRTCKTPSAAISQWGGREPASCASFVRRGLRRRPASKNERRSPSDSPNPGRGRGENARGHGGTRRRGSRDCLSPRWTDRIEAMGQDRGSFLRPRTPGHASRTDRPTRLRRQAGGWFWDESANVIKERARGSRENQERVPWPHASHGALRSPADLDQGGIRRAARRPTRRSAQRQHAT